MAGDDPLIGAEIGAYEIERCIGAGGMGRVYLARQPEIGARVAIKVVNRNAHEADDWAARMFAEARAVNLINHECIVNIVDMVELDDGRPALVMEYLTGAPLDALIKEGPLPVDAVVEIILDVLSAVGAAHERGILHRDLKPANVFVTPRGRAKVLDFGVAKSIDGDNAMSTGAGRVLGTPVYMSPEQARGDAIDARADLFAIGLIAYEALTGERVFAGPGLPQVVEQHEAAAIVPARERREDLGEAIDAVITTSLAMRADRRYQNARAMAAALREAVGPRVKTSLILTRMVRDTAEGLSLPCDAASDSDADADAETVLERPAPKPSGDDDSADDDAAPPWRSPWLILAGVFGLLTLIALAVNALAR